MKRILIICMLCLPAATVFAQEVKQELEQRIDARLAPEKARQWLKEAFPKVSKCKWYLERSGGITSYEAKFKLKGIRYSVEFNREGLIEDVEKRVRLDKMESDQRGRLYLGFAQFDKFKAIKVQEQWTASTPLRLKQAIAGNDPKLATIRYEVEFMAMIDEKYSLWEGLFTQDGKLLSRRKIVSRPTDNLDY